MELFGFGTPSELATPIGQMVKHATDNLRMVPDWTKNLEICDMINRRLENIETANKAILRRLQDSNPQTVFLSLVLLETCMKNCGSPFAASFDRSLMDEMVKIAKGSKGIKNADEALRLIQQWGRVFEAKRGSFPLFFDTFMGLKAKGISFPKEDENPISGYDIGNAPARRAAPTSAPAIPSAAPSASQPSSVPSSAGARNQEDDFIKLQQDLISVMERVKLCREMLLESPGIAKDEALAEVVGFLEACRDRMVEVIEAGTMGMLGEELFSHCLKVNDSIIKTLDAERYGLKIAVEDDEAEGKPSSSAAGGNLLDLDSPKETAPSTGFAPSTAQHGKPASIADDFSIFNTKPAPVAAAPVSSPQPSIVDNPFDDPFAENFGKMSVTQPAAAQPPPSVPSALTAPHPPPAPADEFANNPFAEPEQSQLPSPPTAHAVPVGSNDFDAFLESAVKSTPAAPPAAAAAAPAPSAAPAASAAPSAAAAPPAGTEEDYDAFFASLDNK